MTTRQGVFGQEDTGELASDASVCRRFLTRRRVTVYIAASFWLFLVLSLFSVLDYHELLLPNSADVAAKCSTTLIESDAHVFTTSVTREVHCDWLSRNKHASEPGFALLYREDYMNISQGEADALVASLRKTHVEGKIFNAWYYGAQYAGQGEADRYGLALKPLEQSGDVSLYLFAKLILFTLSAMIVLFVAWLHFSYGQWRQHALVSASTV